MYKIAAVLAGLPNVLLGVFWVFNPVAILAMWGIDDPSGQLIVERRLGVVLLGIGVILLSSRNAQPSPARSAISYGMIVGALSVVAVSVYDLTINGASSGIVPGVGLNLITALAFALVEWQAHRASKNPADV